MTWESVPFVIGNTAQHSEQVFRLLAFQAFNGNEGIMGLGDLKVTQSAVPGASVLIAPGACGITIKNASVTYQSFAGRNPSNDTVAIAPTGGSVRSDMIVAQVEDPNLPGEGWGIPADRTVGPYIFTRVLSGVPNTATTLAAAGFPTRNAIPLARIDIPVSTSTILNAHIVDLRKIANPRRERFVRTTNPASVVNLTSGSFVDWPTTATWSLTVPTWAAQAIVQAHLAGINIDRFDPSTQGFATGQIRVALGTALFTQGSNYDTDCPAAGGKVRNAYGVGDTITVGASLRGTVQNVKVQGLKASGNKNLYVDGGSFVAVDIEFLEAAA